MRAEDLATVPWSPTCPGCGEVVEEDGQTCSQSCYVKVWNLILSQGTEYRVVYVVGDFPLIDAPQQPWYLGSFGPSTDQETG